MRKLIFDRLVTWILGTAFLVAGIAGLLWRYQESLFNRLTDNFRLTSLQNVTHQDWWPLVGVAFAVAAVVLALALVTNRHKRIHKDPVTFNVTETGHDQVPPLKILDAKARWISKQPDQQRAKVHIDYGKKTPLAQILINSDSHFPADKLVELIDKVESIETDILDKTIGQQQYLVTYVRNKHAKNNRASRLA